MIRTTMKDPRRSAARWAVVAGGVGVLACSLAGCSFTGSVQGAGASPSSATGAPPAASGTATASSTPSDTTSSSTPASTTSPAAAPSATSAPAGGASEASSGGSAAGCRTQDLALSLQPDPGGASAGAFHYLVQFVNRGSVVCTLDGHPGVSLVIGGSGQQLGAAAARQGTPAPVTLAPGASADAALTVTDTGVYDAAQCRPALARGLRVYPPGGTTAAFISSDQLTGCATQVSVLTVGPVTRQP